MDRKEQILDVAADLLRRRSFSSFSYQDLSKALGIRKASIHHHFATKADLAAALAERFSSHYAAMLADIERKHERPSDRVRAFVRAHARSASEDGKICPVGACQAEHNVVPERMRTGINALSARGRAWLGKHLAAGKRSGELAFVGTPKDQAALVMAAIQGGLQHARAEGNEHIASVVRQLLKGMEIS